MIEGLSVRQARRLALARAGLLKPQWTDLPSRATSQERRARQAAHRVIERFGYLQLDSVSVAGARTHAIVLMSRLRGMRPEWTESLLQTGEPLFEYWGHEASWLPLDLYPYFEFRRQEFQRHPWWGDVFGQHPEIRRDLMRFLEENGPTRSLDLEGAGSTGWWQLKPAKKVLLALWSAGEVAIRERRNFQRVYDLSERVIPTDLTMRACRLEESLRVLLLRALDGHGWAPTGTLARTWRLRNLKQEIEKALQNLREAGEIEPCALIEAGGRRVAGWIRPRDLELVDRLERSRPRRDQGVLLSPFDPVLWDRARVRQLFDFDQILEIYKPAPQRLYGYYCLPVLAGDQLIARVDLKADRKKGMLRVLSLHHEADRPSARDKKAVESALERYAMDVGLQLTLSSSLL